MGSQIGPAVSIYRVLILVSGKLHSVVFYHIHYLILYYFGQLKFNSMIFPITRIIILNIYIIIGLLMYVKLSH